MDYIAGLAALVLIAVVSLPFLLLLGAPWILVAWIVWRTSRKWPSGRRRVAASALPVALGTAPFFGAHGSVFPAYIVLAMDPKSLPLASVSFLATWGVLFAIGLCFLRSQTPSGPVQSNR